MTDLEDELENEDICILKIELNKKISDNPSYLCSICDGTNYNCPEYIIKGENYGG